jgi:hypothetical protein
MTSPYGDLNRTMFQMDVKLGRQVGNMGQNDECTFGDGGHQNVSRLR